MCSMTQEEFNQRIEFIGKMVQHNHHPEDLDYRGRKTDDQIEELRICTKCQLEQVERYGIDNWRTQFRRLDSLIPVCYDENYKADPEMAEEDRNKMLKNALKSMPAALRQFQECFSENEEFIIKLDTSEFHKSDIFATFISPRCIPDKLLMDLHLCDFSDCKGDPVKRMRLKANPEVIDSIKLIFSVLVNENGTFNREYILPEVHSVNPVLEKRLADYNRYCPGQILVFSDSNSQESYLISGKKGSGISFDRTKILIFQDADSRIRSGHYLQSSYLEEFQTIAGHIAKLSGIVSLLDHWTQATPEDIKKAIKEEFISTLEEVKNELMFVTNSLKIRAMRDLEKIITRLGSNKQASLLVLRSAMGEFETRYEEGSSIRNAKNLDLDHIIFEVNVAKNLLGNFEKKFNDFIKIKNDGISWRSDFEFAFLKASVDELREIKIAPYNVFAMAIQKTFNEYMNFLESSDAQSDEFDLEKKINMCLKLYYIRQSFCDALTPNLSLSNMQVHIKKACDFINDFITENSKDLTEDINYSFIALHDELSLLLDVSADIANETISEWGGKKKRKNDVIREELKKILSKYDLLAVLREE